MQQKFSHAFLNVLFLCLFIERKWKKENTQNMLGVFALQIYSGMWCKKVSRRFVRTSLELTFENKDNKSGQIPHFVLA